MRPVPEPLRRALKIGCWAAVLGGLATTSLIWVYNRKYPFGREHCCEKQLGISLLNYAAMHGGRFPTGGATPEASLSLLYPDYLPASVLRGKAYPEGPAKELLESGKPLTPETCGWRYVDGLTLPGWSGTATSRVALFWDKIGLDHNSGVLPEGGHSVTFMDAHVQVVKEADWPRFVVEQQKAWAAIRRGDEPPVPWVPDDGF